jgi:hypothetical protein
VANGYRKILAILGRGRIRTEEEWRLVNGVLSDAVDQSLTLVERATADRIVHEFELKRREHQRRG